MAAPGAGPRFAPCIRRSIASPGSARRVMIVSPPGRMTFASEAIKRKVLEKLTEKNLYPYAKFYLRDIKQRTVDSSLRFADTFPGHEQAPPVLGAAGGLTAFCPVNVRRQKMIAFAADFKKTPFMAHIVASVRGHRVGDLRCEVAHGPVGHGGGPLHQPQGPDEVRAEALAADGEVLECSLGLRAVQGVDGNPDLAEGILLDSMIAHGPDV